MTMCNRSLKANCNQSQFMRSRVLRSQCLRRRIVGTRSTLQGTSLKSFSSSRNGFRLGNTHSAAQRTRWTQTHRDTMLVNTAVGTRETSICKSSGHEEHYCRSLHETSGWIEHSHLQRSSGFESWMVQFVQMVQLVQMVRTQRMTSAEK